jgi:hypothetical protein
VFASIEGMYRECSEAFSQGIGRWKWVWPKLMHAPESGLNGRREAMLGPCGYRGSCARASGLAMRVKAFGSRWFDIMDRGVRVVRECIRVGRRGSEGH